MSQKHRVPFLCMTLHNSSCYTKNKHSQCHEESFCRRSGYSPTKLQLTDPAAIQAYEKALKATLIYKNAESYCRVSNFERFILRRVEQVILSLVSGYFLDRVVQPSVAHLPSQTYSFWLHHLQDENEPCYYGLGIIMLIIYCVHTC